MDSKSRRRYVMIGALAVALAGVVAYRFRAGQEGAPAATRPAATPSTSKPAAPDAQVPVVALESLTAERTEPVEIERNPFRFEARGSVESPSTPGAGGAGPGAKPGSETAGKPDAESPTPAAPAPPPPIPLKFIGIVEGQGATGRIAVLSDARSVYHGREGDILDGRYRIVKIGVESVEIEYVDGRGRQTIRLTGS